MYIICFKKYIEKKINVNKRLLEVAFQWKREKKKNYFFVEYRFSPLKGYLKDYEVGLFEDQIEKRTMYDTNNTCIIL